MSHWYGWASYRPKFRIKKDLLAFRAYYYALFHLQNVILGVYKDNILSQDVSWLITVLSIS